MKISTLIYTNCCLDFGEGSNDLREKYFHNRVFDSIDALENHLEAALRNMENNQDRVHSIVAWPWIINALQI